MAVADVGVWMSHGLAVAVQPAVAHPVAVAVVAVAVPASNGSSSTSQQ